MNTIFDATYFDRVYRRYARQNPPVYDGLSGPVIRALDRDPTHLHKWQRDAWLAWASERFTMIEWEGIVRYLLPGG